MGTTTLSWLHRPSQNRLGAPLWLFGILAVSVLLFWKLAEDVAGREWIVSFDRGVAASLHAQAPGLATSAFTAVTHLGSALVLVPMTVVAMLALIRSHRRAQAVVMGVAVAGGEALNTALKLAFERQRPSFADSLGTAAGFSFPSGHAMVSLVVYGALAYYVSAAIRARWAKVLVVLSGLGLILAIGFSRIYLGVHYPSDVLAGYSAGLAWLMVCALTMLGVSRRGGRPAEGDRFRPTTQLHRADPPARAVTRGIRSRRPSPM
ncbi:MAG: phosphatase PAP2 family protein [Thermoleophilaceae bacterium]